MCKIISKIVSYPQGRGAGHIHGVLWVDLKEIKFEDYGGQGRMLPDAAQTTWNSYLRNAFLNLRNRQPLDESESEALERFTDMFATCSLDPKVAGEEAVKIAKEVNWHGHSKSCRKKTIERKCRFNFPRFPMASTTFIDINKKLEEGEKISEERRVEILRKVLNVLVEEENGKVLSKAVKEIMEKKTEDESIGDRIEKLLKVAVEAAGDGKPISYVEYRRAVEQCPFKGSTILLRRDLDEIFINNYNPEMIVAWNANIDLQPVFDYYAVITYVVDYWSKGDDTLTDVLKTAAKQLAKDDDARKKCQDLADTFVSHRQVGEAEAYYKLFAHMPLVYSSVATVFVPTDAIGERRRFLKKQDPTNSEGGQKVKDREGLFVEKPDLVSKYERRKLLECDNKSPEEAVRESNSIIVDPVSGSDSIIVDPIVDPGSDSIIVDPIVDPVSDNSIKVDPVIESDSIIVDPVSDNNSIKVANNSGEETHKEDDILEDLTLCQFVKMYQSRTGSVMTEEDRNDIESGGQGNYGRFGLDVEEGELDDEDMCNYIISGKEGFQRRRELPRQITLENLQAGEPRVLYRRTFPRAIRFFKRNPNQDEHKFHLAELMLYHPFRDENDLYPEDAAKCKKLYEEKREEIELVKAQLMPFLKSVEEAQMTYEISKENSDEKVEEQVGVELDPEKEQEVEDVAEEEEEDHPEYLHIDPDQLDEQTDGQGTAKRVFRPIEIPSNEVQLEKARMLDEMQKYVLSLGIQYARDIVKARKGKNKMPKPPLVMVHGGAGSGKSSVIHTLAPMMMDILQQPGDNPECPHVVLTAAYGSAASNINGGTLHATFGFKFGNKFVSLADKARDEKRCQMRNLKCVIIDEISLVSCDLFYSLDLKLREIMMVNRPMGGLAVFLFGDLFQIQPVKGGYVFEMPKNREHGVSFELRNLWEMFTVVNLVENHRQGEDKEYADLLNRVRIGEFTDEDIELLRTRVRSADDEEVKQHSDDLHIYGTNKKVHAWNKAKLDEKEGHLYTIKAANNSRMIKNFKPKVDNAGNILNTPLQAVLNLKKGLEVILVWNVDVADGLANGSRGVLLGVVMKDDKVKRMIVNFHNKRHGEEKREKEPCYKYPEATYIDPYTHQYFLHGSTATCQQFPLR